MSQEYFLTVCLNPTLQKTIILKQLVENEINRSHESYLDASGKGVNVSRVLVQLGEHVVHLTQAGGQNRELFLAMVNKDKVPCRWVDSHSEIRFCNTLINQLNHSTTEIIEQTEQVGEGTETRIFDEYLKLIPQCHTVIISGTKAPGFSDELYPKMVKEAKQTGKKVILDVKGSDLINSLPYRPEIIKPNLSEFLATFSNDNAILENEVTEKVLELAQRKMIEIYEQYGIISVLTRGKYGVTFVDQGKVTSLSAQPIEPINTIGCGDAFTAGLASSLHHGQTIQDAVIHGMNCAEKNALLIHPGVII